jgi:hypothetical protein
MILERPEVEEWNILHAIVANWIDLSDDKDDLSYENGEASRSIEEVFED